MASAALAALLAAAWCSGARAEVVTERPEVKVVGRQLLVDGKPFHFKGVNWNPVRRGGKHPQDLDFRGFVETDAEIMALAGINVLRTYDAITDPEVLDVLWKKKIFVLNSVYLNAQMDVEAIPEKMAAVMHHPAVLMWVVGNEWNYNGFYQKLSMDAAKNLLKGAARKVRATDKSRPIATVFGSVPPAWLLQFVGDDVDVWGINQYKELSFGGLFDQLAGLPTGKPFFLSEYGADAFNTPSNREDQRAQATAVGKLTQEIVAHSSVKGGVCLGGILFEFADEWWKAGKPDAHDGVGDSPPAYGEVYPDKKFNEEWFGLIHIDGSQREAFHTYAEITVPSCVPGSAGPGCGRTPERPTDGERLKACGAVVGCARKLGLCEHDPSGAAGGCVSLSKTTPQPEVPPPAPAATEKKPWSETVVFSEDLIDSRAAAPSTMAPAAPAMVPVVVTDSDSHPQVVQDTFGLVVLRKFAANHLSVLSESSARSPVLALVVGVAFVGVFVSLAVVAVVRRRRRYTPMELVEGADDGQELLSAGVEHPSRVRARSSSFSKV